MVFFRYMPMRYHNSATITSLSILYGVNRLSLSGWVNVEQGEDV